MGRGVEQLCVWAKFRVRVVGFVRHRLISLFPSLPPRLDGDKHRKEKVKRHEAKLDLLGFLPTLFLRFPFVS